MAARELKDGRWVVIYRLPNVKNPITEYFGRGAAAKQAAEERDLEIQLAKKRGKMSPRKEAMYLDTLSQSYLKDAKMRGKSTRFLDEFKAMLNKKILPALCYKPVDEMTYQEVLEFASVTWGAFTLGTRQRNMGYLNAVFRYGLRHGMIEKNPMGAWARQKEPKYDVQLTVQDFQAIMDHAKPYLAWILEVEWELGARPGVTELFSVLWSDVDFEAGTVHVRGSKTEGANRVVPVTPAFLERLKEVRSTAKSEYLVEYRGGSLKRVKSGLRDTAKRAGIKYRVRMYDIRHLFASVMLAGGGDLAAVSKLLGHANISTTQSTYYHVLKGEKERATALRPEVRKKCPVSQNVSQDEIEGKKR
jgi:integrase